MERKVVHAWAPITDLPPDSHASGNEDLAALQALWVKQLETLAARGLQVGFLDKLLNLMAIDTGVIEGLYTLDGGTTLTLIEHGIDASLIAHGSSDRGPELVAAMIRDHKEAAEQLFAFVKGSRRLTTSYVKELHALLTRHQDSAEKVDQFGRVFQTALLKGDYKRLPNNPSLPDGSIHEYCPPEHTAAEMDRLVALHEEHDIHRVPVDVQAAWLHHRFTQIHPFEDGNGRVARMLGTLVLLKAELPPLVVKRTDRKAYLDGLRQADRGSLSTFIEFVGDITRRTITMASQVAGTSPRPIIEVIAEIRSDLRGQSAQSTAVMLRRDAEIALNRLQDQLMTDAGMFGIRMVQGDGLGSLGPGPAGALVQSLVPGGEQSLGFFFWVGLEIAHPVRRPDVLRVCLFGIGKRQPRVCGVSMVLTTVTDDVLGAVAHIPVTETPLLIEGSEPATEAKARLSAWLDTALPFALEEWRRKPR